MDARRFRVSTAGMEYLTFLLILSLLFPPNLCRGDRPLVVVEARWHRRWPLFVRLPLLLLGGVCAILVVYMTYVLAR